MRACPGDPLDVPRASTLGHPNNGAAHASDATSARLAMAPYTQTRGDALVFLTLHETSALLRSSAGHAFIRASIAACLMVYI